MSKTPGLKMSKVVKLEDLHDAIFVYGQSDSYLTFEQAWKAKDWMKKHLLHVFNLVKDINSGYPPTLQEDKNNAALWKGEHWYWFFDEFIRSE